MANETETLLRGFAEALERAPAAALESAKIAVNEGAEFAEREGRRRVSQTLNLSDARVRKDLFLKQRASTGSLDSRISANVRPALATRFGAEQATERASSPVSRLSGDPSRGIPAGQKGAGSKPWSVLRSGQRKAWRNAFFIKLRGSGAWAMVARYGSGAGMTDAQDWRQNLEVVQGMSVSQLWGAVREEVGQEAMELANERFADELARRL